MTKVTMKDIPEIMEMIKQGLPVEGMAEAFEVAVPTMYRILRELNVDLPSRIRGPRLDQEEIDAIVKAYAQDLEPVGRICKRFHISLNSLYYVLDGANVSRRDVDAARVKVEDIRLTKAVELYEQGVVLRLITDETGIHPGRLYAELTRRGSGPARIATPANIGALEMQRGAQDRPPEIVVGPSETVVGPAPDDASFTERLTNLTAVGDEVDPYATINDYHERLIEEGKDIPQKGG